MNSASVSVDSSNPNYIGLINESVHTSDDSDIGDIYAINRDFIVVKRGFVNIHYYYIPLHRIEGWDGSVLWLTITESEVERHYERNELPNPTRYYLKGFPYEDHPPILPHELPTIIPSKHHKPDYNKYVSKESQGISPSAPPAYICDLCDTSYSKEEELSDHVSKVH